MGLVRITSWYPNFNGSHFVLPPSETPQNDWTATQNRVNYDVFAQAPLLCIFTQSLNRRSRLFYRYSDRRNFHTRCKLSYAINFRTVRAVSHTLVYMHSFRMLLNLVLLAKSTKNTQLNRVRKVLQLQNAIGLKLHVQHLSILTTVEFAHQACQHTLQCQIAPDDAALHRESPVDLWHR